MPLTVQPAINIIKRLKWCCWPILNVQTLNASWRCSNSGHVTNIQTCLIINVFWHQHQCSRSHWGPSYKKTYEKKTSEESQENKLFKLKPKNYYWKFSAALSRGTASILDHEVTILRSYFRNGSSNKNSKIQQ